MKNRNIVKRNNLNLENQVRNLHNTLERFFNEQSMWPSFRPILSEMWREEFQPQVNFSEDENNYYIEMDLPGIKKEQVKVEVVEENTLRIQGERKEKRNQGNSKQHYSEVFYGNFVREFDLPISVQKEAIKARYEDGVLFITVPKTSKSKARQINID